MNVSNAVSNVTTSFGIMSHYSLMELTWMQCSAVQCSAVQYSLVLWDDSNRAWYNTVLYSTVQ
jgi:hypothetical protein